MSMTQTEIQTPDLVHEFEKYFGHSPTLMAMGPGRVNLIGEHTDYNDGFVLPVAIHRKVRFVCRPRADRLVHMYSLEYNQSAEFSLDAIAYDEEIAWSNYVQGVAKELLAKDIALVGVDVLISGNVPRASGLSSSAALEVATATGFMQTANASDALTGPEIAKLAQKAENEFVGVNCGIMDQFISVLGVDAHALFIDCRSLDYQLIPFPENASIVIGNTKASRSLAGSAYNERRAQCEEGVAILQSVLPGIGALRDVSSEDLEDHKHLLSSIVYQRCRHVVHENERVLQTIEALQQDDLAQVGQLMNASHDSLRDDYEVSSDALDAMVGIMRDVPGCYGARLTGAGFGGCTVALVEPGVEQVMADAIFEQYPKATNMWPEVYTTRPAAGASYEVLA
ncbi:MAG: galactokinase [Chloroflexota bacterium]